MESEENILKNVKKKEVVVHKKDHKRRTASLSLEKSKLKTAMKERQKVETRRKYESTESNDTARLAEVFKTESEDSKNLFLPKPDFSFDSFRFVHQLTK